jgi:short-subunit dehydrogenase
MDMHRTHDASALVTGASSGLGAAFARRLARDFSRLILVARRRERLEALSRELQAAHPVEVEVLVADLTAPDQLRRVEAHLAADDRLQLLVNNAGFGAYMPFVQLDADRAEELVRLQALAVTRLTRAALPGMITRGRGYIINVASRLAFSAALPTPPLPGRATYAATKAYVVTFTRILDSELRDTGVRVQALCPGLVRTEFHERMGVDPSRLPGGSIMPAEACVEASLAGLQLGEVVCVPALDDPERLNRVDAAHRDLLEHSTSGQVAERYAT